MTNPKEILFKLTESLKQNPLVIAFALVGSQAREDIYQATKYSDLEAYIIVSDEDTEKLEQELPKVVNLLGKVLFSFKHQIGFVATFEDLFRLELPVIKKSDMKSIFSRPKAQTVKVLIDNTQGELEKILNDRPTTLDFSADFKDKITNFWYWQIIGAQYFKKGEIYNSRAVLNIHASTLIKLFELLNYPNTLLLETNKRVEQFLSEEQINILKELTVSYDKAQIRAALKKAMDVFSKIARDIKEKSGYDYNVELEQKIKPKVLTLLEE